MDELRISADELRRRIESGETFTVIDARNPHAWAEASDMAAGAIRIALDEDEDATSRISRNRPVVIYCT